jgi:hypothetical protein
MDLASNCAALLHLIGFGRDRDRTIRRHDPADMGTAFGLEASLTPPLTEAPCDEDTASDYEANAWLRPR